MEYQLLLIVAFADLHNKKYHQLHENWMKMYSKPIARLQKHFSSFVRGKLKQDETLQKVFCFSLSP
jgi:hypothetical protein